METFPYFTNAFVKRMTTEIIILLNRFANLVIICAIEKRNILVRLILNVVSSHFVVFYSISASVNALMPKMQRSMIAKVNIDTSDRFLD